MDRIDYPLCLRMDNKFLHFNNKNTQEWRKLMPRQNAHQWIYHGLWNVCNKIKIDLLDYVAELIAAIGGCAIVMWNDHENI